MVKCAICQNEAVDVWVNPYNIKDRSWYCKKHLKSIGKSFNNFEELVSLTKTSLFEANGDKK